MFGAIASAVAPALLGGLFNRSENRRREERSDPAQVRKRFEAAGFNPLLGVGSMNAPVQYGPTMGDAIMDAGSMALGQFNREKQLEIQRAELEMANERLTQLAEEARLRPTYPGPYQAGRPAGRPAEDQTMGGRRRGNTSTLVSGDNGGSRDRRVPANADRPDLPLETVNPVTGQTVRPVDGRTVIEGEVVADRINPGQTERTRITPSEQYDMPWIFENPYLPSGGSVTEQYGEPAEWLYAPVKVVGDLGYSAYRWGQIYGHEVRNPMRREFLRRQAETAEEIEDWVDAEDEWARDRALRSQMTTPSHITGPSLRDVGSTNPWNQRVETVRPLNRF